ncbi:aminopeptidase N [Thalassotalea insulae]|uniref:Aminopeptidase N n=1 Tax=Thalassotalea insulae TaxID=2056778 RepID=A0ABQ6GMC8_9GAMM|nr:aminopeptidase N [Thalassotalea insulae]GLX76769.1 aminopeptidase N [Thalassotalea insulae]
MTDTNARILADYQPSDFAILSTELEFDLADQATRVVNKMHIERITDKAQPLILDGEQLKLISVQLNNIELSESQYQLNETSLTIDTEAQDFILTVITEIDPLNNTALEGLFKSGDAFCTQCEAEGFRRITYYLDRPDVMAKFTTKVIADKKQYPYLLSNGNKIAAGDLANGKHFVTWQDPFLKPCYLFALVAGDFDVLRSSYTTVSGREVALELFVDRGNLPKAEHAMTSLKKSMQWDEQTFGLEYDLDIYMIVAVDFFNMGAMENKGLNVFNSKFVLADQSSATDTDYFNVEAVIAHEYFHNWTGNRVTCRDWFQLSLKEGLTVFRDQQFSGDMHSAAVTRIQNVRVLRAQQFAEDAGPMAHPIRPEKVLEMNNFYTLTVYEKGAEVIRMIHTLLGQDKFRQGMDLYFQRFDGMAVTCDDFVDAMADGSGIDLSQFKRWYSQSGTPELIVKESFDKQQQLFTLTIAQVNKPSKQQTEKQDLLIPIKLELLSDNEKTQHLITLSDSQQKFEFSGYSVKPIVAFLSGFSAPVKVNFPQREQELALIMVKASDAFNRWDAGQQLLTRYIHALVQDADFTLPQDLVVAFKQILTLPGDAALKAEQLTLPSFDELVEQFEQIDPIKLLDALKQIRLFLAQGLASEFHQQFQRLSGRAYQNDGQSIGERALKNVCLAYLSHLSDYQSLTVNQYQNADNMTDTLAALHYQALTASARFSEQIKDFEQKWYQTPLVMDKCFMLQALFADESIFNKLAVLEQHPLFILKNPNRARSLIGAFSHNNPRYFHCLSGRGYRFLAKHVAALNDINPQVASRLITPLIQFKKFDSKRQAMMKTELVNLSQLSNLSRDLKEKLDAALGN